MQYLLTISISGKTSGAILIDSFLPEVGDRVTACVDGLDGIVTKRAFVYYEVGKCNVLLSCDPISSQE